MSIAKDFNHASSLSHTAPTPERNENVTGVSVVVDGSTVEAAAKTGKNRVVFRIVAKDLYIFDVGGVICHNNDVVPEIAEHLGTTPRALVEGAGSLLRDLGVGRIGPDRFWKQLGRIYGREVSEDLWYTFFHPTIDDCVVDLISELRSRGNVVVAGTNTVEGHYRYHLEHGEYDAFDRVYASHHIGAEKPDPAFYRAILDAERVGSADAVFIDDRAENVAGAQRVGMRAALFTSCAELRRSLSTL